MIKMNINKEFIPSTILINAMAANGVIGDSKENDIPWRRDAENRKLYKWDMEFFKKETEFNPIIMGFKTMQSLKKPLPNRYNFVVSNLKYGVFPETGIDSQYVFPKVFTDYQNDVFSTRDVVDVFTDNNKFIMFDSVEDILEYIIMKMNATFEYEIDKVFFIGGSKLYEEVLKKKYVSNLFITSLDENYSGNVLFPTEYLKNYDEYEFLDYNNGDIRKYEDKNFMFKENLAMKIGEYQMKKLHDGVNLV